MDTIALSSDKRLAGNASDNVSAAATGSEVPAVLQNYLRILRRWRWVILASLGVATVLGLIVTILMEREYTAQASIEISRDSDRVTDFQGVERETSIADQEFYQTQYGLLRSRTLAERVASQLRLTDDPAFFEMYGGVGSDDSAFEMSGDRYSAEGRAIRQRRAGEILLHNLAIEPTRFSRLVNIYFGSPDPAFAARVANAWAENFIESNLERKIQSTSYGREVLQRQLAEYKNRLDESQRQLVAYASRQQIINLPAQGSGEGGGTQERSIIADDLASLNAALNEATADRIAAEAKFRRSGAGGASQEALTNAALNTLRERRAAAAAEYQQLIIRFETGYPAVQAVQTQLDQLDRSIAREEARVQSSIQAEYRQAQQREQALQERVNGLKGDYLDLRRRSIQYNIYQQEVDTNRALYDGLLQRFKEIGVAAGVGVNNVNIVDRADVPEKPSSPNLALNLAISLISGLVIGLALALALEQLDDAIADPSEIERRLGLPLLGSVPRTSEDMTPREAIADRKSELVDAYIAVQTNLRFTTDHGVPRSFSVTSTRPAEGKSTTSLSLAVTLARTGKRVILVDGDMRSPSVHQLGGVDHERGLSNYLSGDDNVAALTFEMTDFGLTAMSAGPIPPNAAELLTGARLSQLVSILVQDYDHVIIDSPPVMGLADAPLIASAVEGVVYTVEFHGIKSSQVRTALARLRAANSRILGGVLTKFEARKAQNGYGYEYGYSYGRESDA